MPADYTQFSSAQFAPSTTPPAPFTAPSAAAPAAPDEFDSDSFDPSTTPPTGFSSSGYNPSTTAPAQFGGGSALLADYAALRAVLTPALALGTLRQVVAATAGETVEAWQLGTGTEADAPASGKIRPTDFHADTNPRTWTRVL